MNVNDKLIAAAKRAARKDASETGASYQKSLDAVARRVGFATWSAFLADPVAVDDAAIAAAAEPDFATIEPIEHATAVVRYAKQIGATAFTAMPRSVYDTSPVLSYLLEDGNAWPVDARGLSIGAVADACLPNNPLKRPKSDSVYYDLKLDMPTLDGALMRAVVRINWNATPELTGVSASVNGSTPPSIDHIMDLVEKNDGQQQPSSVPVKPRVFREPLRRRIARLVRGKNGTAIAAILERGPLNLERGPIVAVAGNRNLRLRPGMNLCAFSPPGTGRMASITIPALLSDDTASYVVQDDGQLLMHTSGWRAQIGPVFVIRLDDDTRDAINPFDMRWLPEQSKRKSHADHLAQSIAPDDKRVARLIAETACELVGSSGSTNLRAIRDKIAADRRPFASEAIYILTPLVDALGHAATSRSTVGPEILRGDADGRPVTIYIVRNQARSTGSRDQLAAYLQTAIWLWVLSVYPGEKFAGGETMGKLPLTTILHDFHRLPRINSLTRAMDVARGFSCGTIITGSTATTARERYGEDGGRIVPLSHLNLMFTQSNADEMKLVDLYDQVEWSEAAEIEEGNCIALTAGGMPPVRLNAARFYRDPAMLERSWNPRTKLGPPPVQ